MAPKKSYWQVICLSLHLPASDSTTNINIMTLTDQFLLKLVWILYHWIPLHLGSLWLFMINSNMAVMQMCKVGATLTPFSTESENLQKICILY